jgi:hypothetical protein
MPVIEAVELAWPHVGGSVEEGNRTGSIRQI